MSTIAAGILTFNRAELLRRALESVISQEFTDLEIVVVDNNSTDHTEAMIREDFPRITYIKNDTNLGGPAGRNVLYRNVESDYVINLDDDGYLEDGTIAKVKEAFDSDPRVGVVALRQCFTDEPGKSRVFEEIGQEACHFLEGVSAFRMKMLDEIGLYPEDFFQYHEALDLGIRVLDSRWKIISRPDIVMWHPRVGGGTDNRDGRWDYHKFKNYLFIITRYFPRPLNYLYFTRKALLYLCYASRHGTLPAYAKALAKVTLGLPRARAYPKVRAETVRRYYKTMKRVERELFD